MKKKTQREMIKLEQLIRDSEEAKKNPEMLWGGKRTYQKENESKKNQEDELLWDLIGWWIDVEFNRWWGWKQEKVSSGHK